MDLFHIEGYQGQNDDLFQHMPNRYESISFRLEDGKPVIFHPFIKNHFMNTLQAPPSSSRVDQNISALNNIETILDDLKTSNCFKSALVKFSKPEKEGAIAGKHLEFIVKPKSSYFFSMQQSFNTQGNITLTYSGGLRNLLGWLDSFSFNYEKSLQKDKLAQVKLNWGFPFWYGGTGLDLGFYKGGVALDTHIIENKSALSVKLSFPFRSSSVKYSLEKRANIFDPDDVCEEILKEEVLPDTIHRLEGSANVFTSKRLSSDFKINQTLGKSDSTTLELDNRFTYPLKDKLRERFPKLSAKYTDLTFEQLFSVRGIVAEKGRLKVNDRIHFSQLRGFAKVGERIPAFNTQRHPRHNLETFKHEGDHLGSRFAYRATSKILFDSYPYLKDNNMLRTFLHFTTIGTSPTLLPRVAPFNSRNTNVSNVFASGLGLDLAYGPAHIEFIYNMWHRKTDDSLPHSFQVKFAFGD